VNPYQLHSPRPAPVDPVETKFSALRQRLTRVLVGLDDDDRVYINGETFRADDVRFLVTTMKAPKQ